MKYVQPFGIADENAPYINGDPSIGRAGSIPDAKSFENPLREMHEIINEANVRGYADFSGAACAIPAHNDLEQLRKAVEGYIGNIFISTNIVKTVGVGQDFTDLHLAFEWLGRRIITRSGYVTFQLSDATHSYDESVIFNHANGDRVAIVGNALTSTPVDTDFTVTGSGAGARATDAAATKTALLAKYKCKLSFVGSAGLGVFKGRPLIANIMFIGDGTGNLTNALLFAHDDAIFPNVHALGAGGYGIVLTENSYVGGIGTISASGCEKGIGISSNSSLIFGDTDCVVYATSNNNDGIDIKQGVLDGMPGGRIVAQGNGANGMKIEKGSFTCPVNAAINAWFKTNAVMGIAAYQANGTTGFAVFSGNGVNSINANMSSNIDAMTATGVAGTCAPTINTVGNGNSYIAN